MKSNAYTVGDARVPDYPITLPERVTTRSYPKPDFPKISLPETTRYPKDFYRVPVRFRYSPENSINGQGKMHVQLKYLEKTFYTKQNNS